MARQDRAREGGARSNLYDDIIGKIIVELVLYPVSFFMQRKYVFSPRSEEIGPEA